MASVDDIYNQITKNRNRSYFPAANPQGRIIQGSGSGNAGYGIGNGALPPDQNPAYQAALSRPRLQGNQLTTIQTSTGTMTVPTASADRIRSAIRPPLPSETTPTPAATPSYSGFNMTQQPFNTVPSIFRPQPTGPEMTPAPMTGSEQFGRLLGLANPGRAISPILSGFASAGRAIGGFGSGVYRGFTGQRLMQPVGGEIGSGGQGTQYAPPQRPQNPMEMINYLTNFGQSRPLGRYFDNNYNG